MNTDSPHYYSPFLLSSIILYFFTHNYILASVKPLVQSTEVDQMADSLAKGSNYDAIEIYGGKKKARHVWMESMTSYQREVEKAVLKKMIFR